MGDTIIEPRALVYVILCDTIEPLLQVLETKKADLSDSMKYVADYLGGRMKINQSWAHVATVATIYHRLKGTESKDFRTFFCKQKRHYRSLT